MRKRGSALPGELIFWFLPMIAQTFDDPARGADVAAFFKDNNPMQTGGPHMIEQVLESIKLNHAAKQAHQESFVRFLSKFQQPPATLDSVMIPTRDVQPRMDTNRRE
jgi:hypothetical protein